MVLGDIARYQTLPIVVYNEHIGGGDARTAAYAVYLLTAVSLAGILLYNRSSLGKQD